MSAAAHLPLYEGLPPSRDAPAPAEAELLGGLDEELAAMNRRHAKLSPVLALQSATRGAATRRGFRERREAAGRMATVLQAHARGYMQRLLPPGTSAADALREERACTMDEAAEVLQATWRRKTARQRVAEASAAAKGTAYALLSDDELFAMPYIHVQRRHVEELRAMMPAMVGAEVADAVVTEPTRYYIIRSDVPESEQEDPLTHFLIGHRRERRHIPEGAPAPAMLPGSASQYTIRGHRILRAYYFRTGRTVRPLRSTVRRSPVARATAQRVDSGGITRVTAVPYVTRIRYIAI